MVLFSRIVTVTNSKSLCGLLHKVIAGKDVTYVAAASISSRWNRTHIKPRFKPFPKNKRYGWWAQHTDPAYRRLQDNENGKLITIEGICGVGKEEFAKKLAVELEMTFFPNLNFDHIYINSYGYDRRSVDDQMPEDCKTCDHECFLKNPNGRNVLAYQCHAYRLKYEAVLDALGHMFRTGEGAIVKSTPWTDFTYVDAMHKSGYISDKGLDYYDEMIRESIINLWRPHLTIYLDCPPEVARERILKRGRPAEVNSKVLSVDYLRYMDDAYKNKFLPYVNVHGHLLCYDWTEPWDVEDIVEEIEKLDFKYYGSNTLFDDWKVDSDHHRIQRLRCTESKWYYMNTTKVYRTDVDEMVIQAEDAEEMNKILDTLPGETGAQGFHPELGDKVLWKGPWI